LNYSNSIISQSYSTGSIKDGRKSRHVSGGLVGVDDATAGSVVVSYWDNYNERYLGSLTWRGHARNDPGITG